MSASQGTIFSSANRVKQARQITRFSSPKGATASQTSSGTWKPTALTPQHNLQISRLEKEIVMARYQITCRTMAKTSNSSHGHIHSVQLDAKPPSKTVSEIYGMMNRGDTF